MTNTGPSQNDEDLPGKCKERNQPGGWICSLITSLQLVGVCVCVCVSASLGQVGIDLFSQVVLIHHSTQQPFPTRGGYLGEHFSKIAPFLSCHYDSCTGGDLYTKIQEDRVSSREILSDLSLSLTHTHTHTHTGIPNESCSSKGLNTYYHLQDHFCLY